MPTFLGANDVDQEGVWKWVDRSAFGYTNWAAAEPGGGTEENCLEMDNSIEAKGGWRDIPCSSDSVSYKTYVCTYDAGKS